MTRAPRHGYLGTSGRYSDTMHSEEEPAWLDARSWGAWAGEDADRTVRFANVVPLPPRPIQTSETHPYSPCFLPQRLLGALHVRGKGNVGMEQFPGKKHDGFTGHQERDLAADLARVREAGITRVVTLVETFELAKCKQPDLFRALDNAGLARTHFPIVDLSTPRDFRVFNHCVREIAREVKAGGRVLVHCRGGLGRTGLVVACVLVFLGLRADRAVAETRKARPRTIETKAQELFVHEYARRLAEARANVDL